MSNSLLQRMLATESVWGPVVLRIIPGIVIAVHGAQKLFGCFGGPGLAGTAQWMESIGLAPGYLAALLAGGAEFFGGVALVFGILVRPASALLAITMLVAIFGVHWQHGLFVQKNGYEYALALLVISLSLLVSGGGRAALDTLLQHSLRQHSKP
jgi:putative oxidoreductase